MDFIKTFQRMDVDELREQVINLLKDAYSDGRITVESLERRLRKATTAAGKEELLALVADIPSPAGDGQQSGGYGLGDENSSWTINRAAAQKTQTLFAVLSGNERRGTWQPARTINAFALMGGITIDLREAEFPRQGIVINAGCIMGSVEVIVPPGINVDLTGIPLLGGMENRAGSGIPGSPEVMVKGIAVLGGVEVKRKEPKKAKNRSRRANRKARHQDRQFC